MAILGWHMQQAAMHSHLHNSLLVTTRSTAVLCRCMHPNLFVAAFLCVRITAVRQSYSHVKKCTADALRTRLSAMASPAIAHSSATVCSVSVRRPLCASCVFWSHITVCWRLVSALVPLPTAKSRAQRCHRPTAGISRPRRAGIPAPTSGKSRPRACTFGYEIKLPGRTSGTCGV